MCKIHFFGVPESGRILFRSVLLRFVKKKKDEYQPRILETPTYFLYFYWNLRNSATQTFETPGQGSERG